MNTILFARSPPAGFFLCPKSSNKQGEELMNDIFENTETMKENEHPQYQEILTGGALQCAADD